MAPTRDSISNGNTDVLCMLFCSCIVLLITLSGRTPSLTHIYHDASSLLLVIISHAMGIFIQTAGKPFLVCLTLWNLLLWWNPHWWDDNTQCCKRQAPA